MHRRTLLFFSLTAVVAMASALWWLSSDSGAQTLQPGGGTGLQAPAPEPPRRAAPPPISSPGTPRVRVEVIAKEKFVPPPPTRVQAVRAGDGVELPTALLAGAGAGFDVSPHVAGIALCAIHIEGARVLRQVVVTAGHVARPVIGAPLVVQGRVRDATGKPLVAAAVWFGESHVDGSRRQWTTDEEGAFAAEVPASRGVPFVVRKEGFAAWWRVVDVSVPPGPCDAVLAEGCTLDVGIAAAATGMEEARLFIVPGGHVSTALSQWPFLLQVLDDGYAIDANGHASVPELPQAGEIGIVVRHPRALRQPAHPVTLKGERARVTVPLQVAATEWRGSVVDDAGQPLAGVEVWARRSGRALAAGGSQRLLPPHLDELGTAAARTGPDGAFVVAAIDTPGSVLSLRASGHAGRDLAASSFAAGQALVLPAWRGGEPEFRLLPPRPGAAWDAETDLAGGLSEAVAADTPWRVSLPHAGAFEFVVSTTVDGQVRGTQRFADVAVTGTIELASPKP